MRLFGVVLVLCTSLALTLTAAPPAAPAPAPPLPLEEWSAPVQGLQARLVLSLHDSKDANIYTFIEFQTNIAHEITVSTHPQLEWHLKDSKGQDIPAAKGIRGGGGGGEWPEQWGTVLSGGIRLSIRIRPNGGFFGDPGTRLLALQTKSWEFLAKDAAIWSLPPGEYSLSGIMTCDKKESGPPTQWVGRIELSPVKFSVAAPSRDP